ncbi:thiamine phosphate synthase [Shewanella marisflavi]|uniref:Thiamine-phosphate synthase n=1 Tax=Shewanella marisflavi TaxID=260364 RepID=A0AAC9U187_9GAMM|nr:thiamine phosphate synthase [Shewanella marisflavi]ASJ96676.1 thiamine phosphate synthase [Shewanella marisflavi]
MGSAKPIVWTIAGSDSGGGAGIQADLATIADLGGHGCSVITCVTAQNSVAVNGVEPVSDALLLNQLNTLLVDLPPKAIKIGLLANQRQIDLLADWLATHFTSHAKVTGYQVPIILDPVMVASCGDTLVSAEADKGLDFSPFGQLLTLITPNGQEFEALSALVGDDSGGISAKAQNLAHYLGCNLLITGGDKGAFWQAQYAEDHFVCHKVPHTSALHQHRGFRLSSERSDNPNHHGSGCTLSSAIASFLAHGLVLHDAVLLAKAYVGQGIAAASPVGAGSGPLERCGWPKRLKSLAKISLIDAENCKGPDFLRHISHHTPHGLALSFPALTQPIGIYPVVGDVKTLSQVLAAGASTVQLRIKQLSTTDELERQIIDAIALGREYGAQLFINDHWQLAVKHGAFGVHLGQEDLFDADLEAIANAGMALGLSSHGVFEMALACQLKPSYIALGHIFPTPTKSMPSKAQGLENLKHLVALFDPGCPRVAIGGIDKSRLEAVKATGVDAVALVRAVTQAASPGDAYLELLRLWENGDAAS